MERGMAQSPQRQFLIYNKHWRWKCLKATRKSCALSRRPGMRMTLDALVAEGDRVAFWGAFSGLAQLGLFPPPESK